MKAIFKQCIIAILFIFISAITASADQAAWVSDEEADSAASVIENQKEIKHFCAPCGDTAPTVEKVKKVAIKQQQKKEYWSVYVNDKAVDLAYVYVLIDDKWVNLAVLLGIDVSDVPPTL